MFYSRELGFCLLSTLMIYESSFSFFVCFLGDELSWFWFCLFVKGRLDGYTLLGTEERDGVHFPVITSIIG